MICLCGYLGAGWWNRKFCQQIQKYHNCNSCKILFSNSRCPHLNFIKNYNKLLSHFFVVDVVSVSKIEHSALGNAGECLFFDNNH